jgi:hypothetical protein
VDSGTTARRYDRRHVLRVREGARHTVVTVDGRFSTVPRHTEVRDLLAAKILDQLGLTEEDR